MPTSSTNKAPGLPSLSPPERTENPLESAPGPATEQPQHNKPHGFQRIPTPVLVKLALGTVAVLFGPIGSYFLAREYVFAGDTFYSGLVAACVANVVMVLFVVAAVFEDPSGLPITSSTPTATQTAAAKKAL
ncbi:vacuolar ATPase assembly integral membrane protein vma21 [Dimargaris verticillata]|uniref:Vacuolar ATPase assembly integral membrane protein vma21 n=1 Tax=Dimargaris verticillata TaxID=2761393 RepID=A0A9W8B6X7_9FUNG|nr:vacuolar ATPase assembly integral membrane protein vma21 [Dimargaris verticillata]